ncbi:MAG: FtsX-like permease family protein [Bacteroidota bacterium]|nr:FtsX-like permease family protein [Bacteroidota bacterium]
MNISSFISSRLQNPQKGSFSSVISWIAVGGVAIGIFVMIISFAILYGFQISVTDKIVSFGGHIQLTYYDLTQSFESKPIRLNASFVDTCLKNKEIKNISPFATKAGLLKANGEVLGVLLKGIDQRYDSTFFKTNLKKGRLIAFSDSIYSKEVIISNHIARLLKIDVDSELILYFMQNPPRVRKLKVCGIYETGMEEFDELYLIGDIKLIQKVNNWPDTLIGGYEIFVNNFQTLEKTAGFVYDVMDFDIGLEKISDKYAAIFDWLTLLDRNVVIFLIIIVTVACFNMASTLLIMIMERTQMIGILKAIGANNFLLGRIFFMNGMWLIFKGLLIGNVFAIVFCLVQYYFKIIPLDPENYYMKSVPVYWDWYTFFLMNGLILLCNGIVLMIPLVIISSIKPIRAIRFN